MSKLDYTNMTITKVENGFIIEVNRPSKFDTGDIMVQISKNVQRVVNKEDWEEDEEPIVPPPPENEVLICQSIEEVINELKTELR